MEKDPGVGRLGFPDLLVSLFRSRARAYRRAACGRDPRLVKSGKRSAILVCVAAVLAFPAAAEINLECNSWRRLSDDQKVQTIDRTIEELVSGSRGREYTSINRTETRRCLENHRNQMVDDFDELCSRGMRADFQALNKTFRSYVWSCAQ